MSTLIINNMQICDPSKLDITLTDIMSANSGRNAAGDMLQDRVAQKVKLSCAWNWLTNSQCSQLLQAIDSIYFTINYPNPKSGTINTGTFYVSDRTVPVYWMQNGVPGWKGISMDFIQR